jgi:hypothetical protein
MHQAISMSNIQEPTMCVPNSIAILQDWVHCYAEYETFLCFNSREQKSHRTGKGSSQSRRRRENQNQRQPQQKKAAVLTASDCVALARRRNLRRANSLCSVCNQACLETQKFFQARKRNTLLEHSDMEKPSVNPTPSSEDLVPLQELAGILAKLSLSNDAADQGLFHGRLKMCRPPSVGWER